MATIEFITKENLKQFRAELLQDITEAIRKPKLLETNKERTNLTNHILFGVNNLHFIKNINMVFVPQFKN